MKKKTQTVKKGKYIPFGDYWGRVEGVEFAVRDRKGGEIDSAFTLEDALVARAIARHARDIAIFVGARRIHNVTSTHIDVGCTKLTHAEVEQVTRLLEEAE